MTKKILTKFNFCFSCCSFTCLLFSRAHIICSTFGSELLTRSRYQAFRLTDGSRAARFRKPTLQCNFQDFYKVAPGDIQDSFTVEYDDDLVFHFLL